MKKINKQKELNKLAEKLGIAKNRKVDCISCHKKINTKDAYIVKKDNEIFYLCPDCFNNMTMVFASTQSKKHSLIKEIEEYTKTNRNFGEQIEEFYGQPYEYNSTDNGATFKRAGLDNKYTITSNNTMSTALFEPKKYVNKRS